jgi:hypothetical protein
MTPLEALLQRLARINTSRTDSFVSEFESLLEEILRLRDPDCIRQLLVFFEDDPPFEELMFSIIHSIESFDDPTYIRELLQGLQELSARSPRWATILLMRVLNADPARLELIRQLGSAGHDIREKVRGMVRDLAARRPKFAEKAAQILDG